LRHIAKLKNINYFLLPVSLIILLIFVSLSINFIPGGGKLEKNEKVNSRVFNHFNHTILLVFFGYVGCNDICIPRMTELAKIYQQLKQRSELDVGVVFINLTQLSNKTLADLYAKHYNPDFNGIYLKTQQLNELIAEFNVFKSPSLTSENAYNHTASLFLLKKDAGDYYLRRIYIAAPFDQSSIIADINKHFL